MEAGTTTDGLKMEQPVAPTESSTDEPEAVTSMEVDTTTTAEAEAAAAPAAPIPAVNVPDPGPSPEELAAKQKEENAK
jgi:hypothetical protein